ncbi:23S rRNA (cytosine1962-C5)-methyltransferase [Deinobacterium chartae]|uniref:23S rRNA (Cytosine1962-C5)-methyltransferase n=1 Tax=Deinobacterium chartae TaxID=521158 RepID=A0A841HY43_9DEIO|nr:23S rRNA (cytosine1962-C5)-methyltransferase [Deinobacterium chartae]
MRVKVKAGKEKKLLNHYPFGHAGDILEAEGQAAPGEVVDVVSESGTFVGRAYFNAHAPTPLRMLTLKREPVDRAFYAARVKRALARREGRVQGTQALRVVHGEADGIPGVIADLFGEVLSVQIRNAGAEAHRDLILAALREATGASAAFERSETVERRKEGLEARSGVLWGELPETVEFEEDGLRYRFSPLGGQKTGFYLDQRDNRRLMSALVREGDRFLDVYSYTGGFSLLAARAGAQALAVDKDALALSTLEATARANGLDKRVGMRLGDALKVLEQLENEGRRFHHAVLDPPTLAKRKDDVPGAKRIFTEGAARVMRMLEPGGHLLISTCAHYIRVEDLLDAARLAAGQAGRTAEVLNVTYQPADHPWMLLVPESLYLKSLLLRLE